MTPSAKLGKRPGNNRNIEKSIDITKLQLQLSAKNLNELDAVKNAQNYFCNVHVRKKGVNEWTEVGTTEVIFNSSSPSWPKTLSVEYTFSVEQELRFQIRRHDNGTKTSSLLGEARCSVARLVVSEGVDLPIEFSHHRRSSTVSSQPPVLHVRVEEERGDIGESVTMRVAVQGLKGRRLFFTISRRLETRDEKFAPALFSEVLRDYKRNKANLFKPLNLPVKTLCNGNYDAKLRLEFLEYDRNGIHKLCGFTTFTLSLLEKMQSEGKPLKFEVEGKQRKNLIFTNFQKSGVVQFINFEITSLYSFLDYIRAGVEINLMIAVDMSSSNGNPYDSSSRQSNKRDFPNDYVVALREVGFVLAQYDTDGKFPAYGFGACLPPKYETLSFVYALSGDSFYPSCNGIEGVVSRYYDALDVVAPHQPCYINPVIAHCVEDCAKKDESTFHTTYTVLLLITDGVYQDHTRIADTICAACDLPFSLVVVGVGKDEGNFKLLEELDGDDVRLCDSNGVPASRDIVQFVPFEKHRDSPARLAKETLDEIPTQLIDYMRAKGLRPSDIETIRDSLAHNIEPAHIGTSADFLDMIEPVDSYDAETEKSSLGNTWSSEALISENVIPPQSDNEPFIPPADQVDSTKLKNATYSSFELPLDVVGDDEKIYENSTLPYQKDWIEPSSSVAESKRTGEH